MLHLRPPTDQTKTDMEELRPSQDQDQTTVDVQQVQYTHQGFQILQTDMVWMIRWILLSVGEQIGIACGEKMFYTC